MPIARFRSALRAWLRGVAAFALVSAAGAGAAQDQPARSTVVLVHGAFADSSSWDGVVSRLQGAGYPVVALANPLRGPSRDADYLAALLATIDGPVVLVGHSYGGAVISAAATRSANVRALVYVAAFLPDAGETSLGLSGRFPGSTLGGTLAPPVPLPDGGHDLYIRQDRFHAQFAADVPADRARRMAAAQRPIAEAALAEPAGAPAWRTLPAWSIYGSADRNIPAAAHAFMAARAQVRRAVAIEGASHVVMVSHPREVAGVIEEAAQAR
jgi:pimeloyl-ACP methyl ester carboxylesterase